MLLSPHLHSRTQPCSCSCCYSCCTCCCCVTVHCIPATSCCSCLFHPLQHRCHFSGIIVQLQLWDVAFQGSLLCLVEAATVTTPPFMLWLVQFCQHFLQYIFSAAPTDLQPPATQNKRNGMLYGSCCSLSNSVSTSCRTSSVLRPLTPNHLQQTTNTAHPGLSLRVPMFAGTPYHMPSCHGLLLSAM